MLHVQSAGRQLGRVVRACLRVWWWGGVLQRKCTPSEGASSALESLNLLVYRLNAVLAWPPCRLYRLQAKRRTLRAGTACTVSGLPTIQKTEGMP